MKHLLKETNKSATEKLSRVTLKKEVELTKILQENDKLCKELDALNSSIRKLKQQAEDQDNLIITLNDDTKKH